MISWLKIFACLSLTACGKILDNEAAQKQAALQRQAFAISHYPGIQTLSLSKNTSWELTWPAIEGGDNSGDLTYAVFLSQGEEEFSFENPLEITKDTSYTYTPKNPFKDVDCFLVRINSPLDKNTQKLCTKPLSVQFQGISSLERHPEGNYTLHWEALPVDSTSYSVFQRNLSEDFNFQEPLEEDILTSQKDILMPQRGETFCFIVRYNNAALPTDTNASEFCTEEEKPLTFAGIKSLTAIDSHSVKILWESSQDENISAFGIYNSSQFDEKIAQVAADQTEIIIENLSTNQIYTFGVRALDAYGRPDDNLAVRPIYLP